MALSLRRHDYLPRAIDAYAYLSPIYDAVFGLPLQPGRVRAMARLAIGPGHEVLEVGAGTGLNAPLYPRHCRVTAVDLSAPMLERARARVARERLTHITLVEADAARLTFADDSFDRVYAPYIISVVPDPVQVVREMCRVCRPGGRIVILNHFRSAKPLIARIEQALSPLTIHAGFKADLEMHPLLEQARLRPLSIEKVNAPAIWSLVTAVKE